METTLRKTRLSYNGKELDIDFPVYHFKDYKIRMADERDLEQIAKVSYPGMMIDLKDEKFLKKMEQGLVFSKETNGFVFVVVENKDGEIVGRSYVKSWHVDYFQKPRYSLRKNSVLLVDASHSFNGKKILEIGGVVVKPEYQGQGLGSALLYVRLQLIDYLRNDLHLPLNSIMMTNIGPFRAQDNFINVDFSQKLKSRIAKEVGIKELSYEKAMELTEHGRVISIEDFYHELEGLEVLSIQNKVKAKAPYYFGAPREASYHAYTNSKRLCFGEPILIENGVSYSSPFIFRKSECIHFDHGGSYFIHNFV
ncbi:GNAT family N-acetyltransferase [Bacteriovorax sp. DB6_IX]|uniref:GNAT family N-acetyltransferase n=1 Tax=Bacteriovorax sp. DB6_IX TaxID=1353530 RepID=UPI00038A172A|nr:GNAT family N-acetyltransferase [Bacteriovorax sp. DB6_IX]EQC51500.1 acetyltransferase, GNAT domain protein [Bacteriovorax sp. DB6_IX]